MKQPNYNPQEALERVKLMMGYDSNKTLTENKEVIFEQNTAAKTAAATAIATGAGAAAGAGLAASNVATSTALGKATWSAMGLGSRLVPALGGTAAASLGTAVVLGGAALALTPLIVWYMDKDTAEPKVRRIFNYCSSDAAKIAKVPRKLSDARIRDLSDQIYDALVGLGTDEESVYSAFRETKTASDVCALVNRFERDYGDLMDWLSDDFDASSEWEQIFRPIRNAVEDTLLKIKVEPDEVLERAKKCGYNSVEEYAKGVNGVAWKCPKTGTTPVPPVPVKTRFKPCSGTYKYLCIADAIKTVQACLGLKADGKWGDKTQAKLKSIGYTSFTDADISKICKKESQEVTGETPDVTGEITKINPADTNF